MQHIYCKRSVTEPLLKRVSSSGVFCEFLRNLSKQLLCRKLVSNLLLCSETLWNLEIARIVFIKCPRKIIQSTRWRHLSWEGCIVWKKLKCKSSSKVFLFNVGFRKHPFLKKNIWGGLQRNICYFQSVDVSMQNF